MIKTYFLIQILLPFLRRPLELLPRILLHRKQLLVVETDTHIGDTGFEYFIVGKGRWLILDYVVQKLNGVLDVLTVVDFLDGLYLLVEVIKEFGEGRYFILTPLIVFLECFILFFDSEDEVVEAVQLFLFYL